MKKYAWFIAVASVVLLPLLSACGGSPAPETTTVTSPPEEIPPPTHQHDEERPEVGIALTFAPSPVMAGDEVKFSIWMRAERDTSGGTVIIGIEKATVPMSTMIMIGGMVEAVEETPGNYTLEITFPEEGDYIVHTHFIPRGGSMMEMMENHADFGPLRVYRDPPDISMPEKVDIVTADQAYDPRRVEDEAFVPETLTVKAGTTVTWRNDDESSHTVTEHEYEWTSPLLNPGETWSYTFNEPGVYDYHCNPHLWMVGTIIVVE